MKIYKDEDLTKEILEETLDLGIVSAGDSEKFTFWVSNDTHAFLRDLIFLVDHDEVEIIKAPETLTSQEKAELIIKWSPSITLKEGLKTIIRVRGRELWG